jgi:hypothetical protein
VPQTFSIEQPLESHFRAATCEEVDCPHYLMGWVTVLDPGDPSHWPLIRAARESGRRYEEMRSEEAGERTGRDLAAGMLAFVFPAGQRCFRPHYLPIGREPLYVHTRGDRRRVHYRGEHFNEDFNEEAYRIGRLLR